MPECLQRSCDALPPISAGKNHFDAGASALKLFKNFHAGSSRQIKIQQDNTYLLFLGTDLLNGKIPAAGLQDGVSFLQQYPGNRQPEGIVILDDQDKRPLDR